MGLFEICCLKDFKLEDTLLVNKPKYFQKLYVFLQIWPYNYTTFASKSTGNPKFLTHLFLNSDLEFENLKNE